MPAATNDDWIGTSGAWSVAGNWSLGTPGSGDNAVFDTGIPVFVTYATTDAIAALSDPGDPYATLDLTAGALSLTGGAWDGGIDQAAGSLALGAGTLTLSGPATLAGAIAGPGVIAITGTAEALSGLAISGGATLAVSGALETSGAVTLGAAPSDASAISIESGATFVIANPTTLAGEGTGGLFNSGLIEQLASGTSDIAGDFSNSGTLAIAHGVLGLYGGTDTLAGTISGGGGLAAFGGARVAISAGAVITAATLEALNAATTLTLEGGLDYGGAFTLGPGSDLLFAGANETLTLSGVASLGGVIAGTSATAADRVNITGEGDLNGLILSDATLADTTSLTMDGPVTLEGGGEIAVAAGASFTLLTNAAIGAEAGMGTIDNAGLIAKTGGDATSYLTASLNDTGTLAADAGTLALDGGSASLGGALSGQGTLLLTGGGNFTLDSGVVVTVADLAVTGAGSELTLATSLSDAGGVTLGSGATLALGGESLTLSGSAIALDGTLAGPGTLALSGSADLSGLALEGGATLTLAGSALADGPLTLGTASGGSELIVEAGGSLTLATASAISGTGTLVNDGVITGWNGLGATTLSAALDNQGTLALDAGTLALTGAVSNGGLISVADGALSLAGGLGGGGTLSLGAGAEATLGGAASGTIHFAAADAALTLDALASVAATITGFAAGDTIDLATLEANGFSYSGGTLTLTDATGGGAASVVGALALPGLGSSPSLALANDGANGTEILLSPASTVFSYPSAAITLDSWNWSSGGWETTPTSSDDAIIPNDGSTAQTIAFINDTTVEALGGGNLVTLLLSAGTLAVDSGLAWNGGLTVDGGEFDLLSGGTIGGGFSLAAGNTAVIGANALTLGSADIAGTISGGGTLDFATGGGTIEAGAAITTGGIAIADALTLAASLSYAGDFALAAAGTLALGGETLTLSGDATLDGTVAGAGSLIVTGTGDLADAIIGDNAGLIDSGTLFDGGAITLGAGGAGDLSITAGALFDSLGDNAIAAGTTAAISNAGIFEKTGGAGTATIAPAITSTGTILATDGEFLFTGTDSFSGTLGGAGTIALAGNATLGAGLAVTASAFALAAGADATLAGNLTLADEATLATGATLTNGANVLTLSGAATLAGTLAGSGTIAVSGSAIADGLTVSGSETVDLSGTITQDGNIELGAGINDSPLLDITAGGVFAINADANINTAGTDAIDNAGLLEKNAANGISYLYGNLTNSGTIAVQRGTLSLAAGAATLGGTLAGAGTLALTAGAAATSGNAISFYTLTPGVSLSVAGLGVLGAAELIAAAGGTYAGQFTLAGGGTLDPDGTTLTLSGAASLDGAITGAGTVIVSGAGEASGLALVGGAVLSDTGTLLLDGAASIGSASSTGQLLVGAAGTLAITADAALTGYNAGAISNAGLVEKLAGLGASTLSGGIGNSGTLLAARGTIDVTGTLTNNALIEAVGGTIVLANGLAATGAGSGLVKIGAGGGIVLDGALASSQIIDFTAASGELSLASPGQVFGAIEGFASGDVIDLSNATYSTGDTLSFTNHTLSVSDAGSPVASLTLQGTYSASQFQLASDGASGTDITLTLPCFASGTRIETPAGPVPVEALAVGDRVTLAGGGTAAILWIGWREIDCRRHKYPARVRPIRISAGAFGENLPRRDVVLSPDHAVFVDGVLIPIKFLVNGRTIREETVPSVRYFHIELARHDVLLSEGLAVESYLDTGNRGDFANAATAPAGSARGAQARCAPLCRAGKTLATIHGRLARRAFATQPKDTATARRPAARTARKSAKASAMQPAVGAKSAVATWRKIAEPRPGRGGSSFQPSTPTMS